MPPSLFTTSPLGHSVFTGVRHRISSRRTWRRRPVVSLLRASFLLPPGASLAPARCVFLYLHLQNIFEGWSPDVHAILDATREDEIQQRDLYDRPPSPIKPWSDGPVALLGDSIHAMMPNLGQVTPCETAICIWYVSVDKPVFFTLFSRRQPSARARVLRTRTHRVGGRWDESSSVKRTRCRPAIG